MYIYLFYIISNYIFSIWIFIIVSKNCVIGMYFLIHRNYKLDSVINNYIRYKKSKS